MAEAISRGGKRRLERAEPEPATTCTGSSRAGR